MTAARPTCKNCGRPLMKRTYTWHEKPINDNDPEPEVGKEAYHGIVRQITKTQTSKHLGKWVHYWCGNWGRYGDNHFCGINCGYRWALKQLRGR